MSEASSEMIQGKQPFLILGSWVKDLAFSDRTNKLRGPICTLKIPQQLKITKIWPIQSLPWQKLFRKAHKH